MEASASSLRAPGARASAKAALPEWFPDDEALEDARERVAARRVAVDVLVQADHFRNHALSEARLSADWRAAWANWIGREIDRAPPVIGLAPVRRAATWNGPTWLREAVVAVKGAPWSASYLEICGYAESPGPTLISPLAFIADRLRSEVGDLLENFTIVVDPSHQEHHAA
jgi:hypothetical protein